MSGQGFEFTPGGIAPMGAGHSAAGVINAGEAIAKLEAQRATQEAERVAKPALATAMPKLTGRSLVQQIRDRLRVIRRELKALRKLEAEEIELLRLLAAAKAPPAGVTDINQARKSG